MVSHFYMDVASLPQITDQEMSTAMQQLSVLHVNEFDTIAALKELYIYVTKYREEVKYQSLKIFNMFNINLNFFRFMNH